MKLSAFVSAQRCVVPLETTSLPAAAAVLLERLDQAGAIADMGRLRERVAEERPEDIVAMGDRAFLLHYRTDAVRELVVAIGTAREPICRELGELGKQCARIVLLIVSPPRMAARYLQLVGTFARLLSDAIVVEEVLDQPNAEALERLPLIARYDLPEQLVVSDIMTARPRTIGPDSAMRDAARDMVRAGVEGLPVVDDEGRLVGMLSERELLRHLLSSQLMAASSKTETTGVTQRRTVRDVMTRQVLCVSPEQPLAEVASLMSNKEIDRVPVVHAGRLVGVLTRGDIVRKLIGY
ncbi:MAG TPA: CBS domain-containing protein [Gemmatimonadaceae bacterium]|nr:CBS domain-containing protein [Gemmatimonadaceae bacterium]